MTTPLVEHPPSVALVILDADQGVCVRQPRRGASRPTFEVPQETLEPGETPREAAERGLAEECGLTAREWKELGAYLVAPAYSTERVHVFSARVCGRVPSQPDEDEEIELVLVQGDEVWDAVDDAVSLAALALWQRSGAGA